MSRRTHRPGQARVTSFNRRAKSQALGTRERVNADTFCMAPRPSAPTRHRTRTRSVSLERTRPWRDCSPLKRLGCDQPGDSQVHGVAPGAFRALDVPERPATHGQSQTHAASVPSTIIRYAAVDSPYRVGSQAVGTHCVWPWQQSANSPHLTSKQPPTTQDVESESRCKSRKFEIHRTTRWPF